MRKNSPISAHDNNCIEHIQSLPKNRTQFAISISVLAVSMSALDAITMPALDAISMWVLQRHFDTACNFNVGLREAAFAVVFSS